MWSTFLYLCILGEPGATSRDEAIFSGERHFWRESLFQGLKSPWALFLTKRVPEVSKSVPLIGHKNFFLANQRGDLAGKFCPPFTQSGFLHRSTSEIPVRSFRKKGLTRPRKSQTVTCDWANFRGYRRYIVKLTSVVFFLKIEINLYSKSDAVSVLLFSVARKASWESKLKLTLCTTSETFHDMQITVAQATQLCRIRCR